MVCFIFIRVRKVLWALLVAMEYRVQLVCQGLPVLKAHLGKMEIG